MHTNTYTHNFLTKSQNKEYFNKMFEVYFKAAIMYIYIRYRLEKTAHIRKCHVIAVNTKNNSLFNNKIISGINIKRKLLQLQVGVPLRWRARRHGFSCLHAKPKYFCQYDNDLDEYKRFTHTHTHIHMNM